MRRALLAPMVLLLGWNDAAPGQQAPPPLSPAATKPGAQPAPPGPENVTARLVTQSPTLDPIAIAGWPTETKPIYLGLEEAYGLALIRARSEKPADRAAILDPKTWEAEKAKAGVADFARFKAEFLAARQPDRAGKFMDPAAGHLDVLRRLQSADLARRNVAAYERHFALYQAYAKGGAASGVSQTQVDQVSGHLLAVRETMLDREREFQDALDEFQVGLGLPPGTKLMPGPTLHDGFRRVFDDLDKWKAKEDNEPKDIWTILGRLPTLPDLVIGGISAREFGQGRAVEFQKKPAVLDDLITAAGRHAADDRSALPARSRVRRYVRAVQAYDYEKVALGLAIRRGADILDQIIAPPPAIDAARAAIEIQALTQQLLGVQTNELAARERLIAAWTEAQTQRLALYPLLGVLPYDDWKSFIASFGTTGPNETTK